MDGVNQWKMTTIKTGMLKSPKSILGYHHQSIKENPMSTKLTLTLASVISMATLLIPGITNADELEPSIKIGKITVVDSMLLEGVKGAGLSANASFDLTCSSDSFKSITIRFFNVFFTQTQMEGMGGGQYIAPDQMNPDDTIELICDGSAHKTQVRIVAKITPPGKFKTGGAVVTGDYFVEGIYSQINPDDPWQSPS